LSSTTPSPLVLSRIRHARGRHPRRARIMRHARRFQLSKRCALPCGTRVRPLHNRELNG
jgi:hypothetical protein